MKFWERGRTVVVNQSGANIKIAHAKEVNAAQIGGTINNYYSADGTVETTIDEQDEQSGRSISIGVVNWSDVGL